jgi:hypoxanthine-guanine phosphoribosyltransferase
VEHNENGRIVCARKLLILKVGTAGFEPTASCAPSGDVKELEYFLVDDFVGQGGTLANLRGFVESRGAKVLGATSLTGKGYSAKLSLSKETLRGLKGKHGTELEQWWVAAFGYGFERLTESEARYLTRADDAHSISARIVAAAGK